MSTEELNMLVSTSKEVPVGAFIVARVKPKARGAKLLGPEDIQEVFHGCGSQSELLFGWGIARKIAKTEGVSLLIFNPDEIITLPEDCNE
jgi:hypothetical protein